MSRPADQTARPAHPLLKSRKPVQVEASAATARTSADPGLISGVRVVRLKPTPSQPAERIDVSPTVAPGPSGRDQDARPHGPLADLVDQAAAQLFVLRRTLDEAVSLTSAIHRESSTLTASVALGQTTKHELAERLAQAGAALGTLDRAADGIAALEDVLGRIGSLRDALAADFDRRLERHKQEFESRLARMDHDFKAACAKHAERAESIVAELSARLEARVDRAEDALSRRIDAAEAQSTLEIEQAAERLRDHADRAQRCAAEAEAASAAAWNKAAAEIDRRAAQAQARTTLLLDSAQEQLTDLERRAARLHESGEQALRQLGTRASTLLGADPAAVQAGSADWRRNPAPGTLADLVSHAESVLTTLQQASGKARDVAAAAETSAEQLAARLHDLQSRLDEALARTDGRSALLERCMDDATRHAEDMALVAKNLSALLDRAQRRVTEAEPAHHEADAAEHEPTPGTARPARRAKAA